MSREVYIAVDDGFYYLNAVPVTLRELVRSGIKMIGPGRKKVADLDCLDSYRIVFGSVTDDYTVEPYCSVEVLSRDFAQPVWLACEESSDANIERIETILASILSDDSPPAAILSGTLNHRNDSVP